MLSLRKFQEGADSVNASVVICGICVDVSCELHREGRRWLGSLAEGYSIEGVVYAEQTDAQIYL